MNSGEEMETFLAVRERVMDLISKTKIYNRKYDLAVCNQTEWIEYIIKKELLQIKNTRNKGRPIKFLKKDLFVKPFVPGAQFGNPNDQSAAFPVYRENNNKMYLPRFYGIQRYGVPDRCDIEEGDDIDVPFELSLRDYQVKIVDIYCNYVYFT